MKPPTPGPQNYHGAPGLGVGYRPSATPISHTHDAPAAYGLPRSVPTLTIFVDGNANLNAEGSGLCAGFADGICLRSPPAVRPGRTPQLWEIGPGECYPIHARPDKARQLRFRVDLHAAPPAGRYLLLPVANAPERFSLLPF